MVNLESKKDEVIANIEMLLRGVKGVVGIMHLSRENIETILELERKAEQNFQPTTRVENEGVREVSRREAVLAMVKTPQFSETMASTVVLVSGDKIIGEEIHDSERTEELKGQAGIVFVGENFVIYRDRIRKLSSGDAFFMFPPVPFPQLERYNGIRDVVSASPTSSTDVYIKRKGDWNLADPRLGTILIGFNLV
jgi:molybdopterin converting factor small subunit